MSTGALPSAATIRHAIEIYLAHAYDAPPPPPVAARVAAVRDTPDETIFDSPVLERRDEPERPRYALRLGNRDYPFMKLAIEWLPSRRRWLFMTDTHDQHVCPAPDDPERAPFMALMARNRAIAAEVEEAWRRAGIDTFRGFLAEELARRKRALAQRPRT